MSISAYVAVTNGGKSWQNIESSAEHLARERLY